jgi:SAM-dependent methyltransferase
MRAYRVLRAVVRDWKYKFPKNVLCNICGWSGRRFASDQWHPRTVCWRCGSEVRHRLLAAALNSRFVGLLEDKRVLHFAPERAFSTLFTKTTSLYRTANIDGSADLRLDLTTMPNVKSGSYDIVIACDVLEHVADDHAALLEIRRVLTPGGWAILTVPQKDGLEETYEDPRITDPRERERAFGQWDHLRIYGDSFVAIVGKAGFRVSAISSADFPSAAVKRNVLFPPVLSTHPLATNHRKVFFAQKA